MEHGKHERDRDAGSPPDDDNELPKPESCYQAGLECRSCVRASAANLAQICQDLSAEAVRDSFFKIYPDLACLPMARTFARAYRVAGEDATEAMDDFAVLAASPA